MTLTTDELRQIVETDHVQCGDAAAMARELLANREAQPVAFTSPAQLKKYPNEQREAYGQYSEKFCVPLYTAPPAPPNAKAVGYFLRFRVEWHTPSKWSAWTEIDEATYDNAVKIIATGEADAGRFYEARILYDAPPTPVNAAAWEMRYWSDGYNIWGDWERISEGLYTRLSAEHATDNDYEFRVLYDAPPAPGVEEVRR